MERLRNLGRQLRELVERELTPPKKKAGVPLSPTFYPPIMGADLSERALLKHALDRFLQGLGQRMEEDPGEVKPPVDTGQNSG